LPIPPLDGLELSGLLLHANGAAVSDTTLANPVQTTRFVSGYFMNMTP